MRLQLQGREEGEAAHLFNGDGSAAPNAVCSALQAFLLFVWVTSFPRGEQVGPALGLLPDRCGRVGGRDIDPQFLLAGARRRRDGRGVVT